MKKDNDILKELQDLSPELSKLKKDFDEPLPYNYFESLPEKIFDRIRTEEAKVPVWQSWLATVFQPKLRLAYAIAAVFVLGLFIMNNMDDNPPSLDDQFAELSQNELSSYVMANLDDFDGEWLANTVQLSASDELLFLDSDNEAIEEYLLEEMDDMEFDEIIL